MSTRHTGPGVPTVALIVMVVTPGVPTVFALVVTILILTLALSL